MEKKKGMKKDLHSNTMCHNLDMCSPACFFCLMKEQNPAKRHVSLAKYLKEMPSRSDHGLALVMSALWNVAMTEPNDPELLKLGILECMSCLIRKGLKDRRWLLSDQNVYIPYYAAHIIGSYTMNMEEFAEMAVEAGVIPPLVELLRGRLTWVEQRVAVRALGHLATYQTTFSAVSQHEELVELAMELSYNSLEIVYTQFLQWPSRRLRYHCDLMTRGKGGAEMENRKAEEWASQLQCWSLHLLNCFAYRDKFVPGICKPGFLKKLPGMWGGLVNENSPAGVGLLRILCYHRTGRIAVADCGGVIDSLCNIARSSDDWQYMAVDCLLRLLQDPHTRSKVIDTAIVALVDLAEMQNLGKRKRVGEVIMEILLKSVPHTHTDLHTQGSSRRASLIKRHLLDELWSLKQRMKWEKNMSKEDLHVKRAAAMVVKLEGNSKFTAGDLKGAVAKYTEALTLCPLKTMKERIVLYSNRAQCHLLLQDPDSAISDTTRALSISNPANSHNRSLWRRAQAYDIKDLAKESLLDAIMFINEWSMTDNNVNKDKKHVKVPYYAAQMVRKQMQATWLFRDAARKYGDIAVCNGDCNESKSLSSPSPSPSSQQEEEDEVVVQEEEEKSDWETVSEGHEEERIKSKTSHCGSAPANGNGKSHHLQQSSLAHNAGVMMNNQPLESRANESVSITTAAATTSASVNYNTTQGHGSSGANPIMVLPTIKEESLSEEERLDQIQKKNRKWINTPKHEYMTMMMKNKRIESITSSKNRI